MMPDDRTPPTDAELAGWERSLENPRGCGDGIITEDVRRLLAEVRRQRKQTRDLKTPEWWEAMYGLKQRQCGSAAPRAVFYQAEYAVLDHLRRAGLSDGGEAGR